jgi:PAS domain S-box-containing protein
MGEGKSMDHLIKDIDTTDSLLLEMFDNLPSLAWMAKPDGYIYWYNKRWYEYTGMKSEEAEGWGWQSVHDTETLPTVFALWENAIRTTKPFEITFPLKGTDGIFRPFLTRVAPLKDKHGKVHHWLGTSTDITELVKTEEALRESQEQFKAVVEHAPIGISHVDLNGKWILLNKRLCEIVGYTKEELSKMYFQDITHPDDLATDLRLMQKIKDGVIDGYTREKRYIRKDKQIIWITITTAVIRDEEDKVKYFVGVAEDITEVKKTQEKQRHLQLISQERNQLLKINKAKDEFMSIVSHQLRTPATAVKQYLGMLINGFSGELTDEQKRYLLIADESNNRQLKLVNDLLKTAQIDDTTYKLQRRVINLTELLKETLKSEELVLKMRGQELVSKGLDKNIAAKVDPIEIKLAISNLLENASKYSGPGKRITVSLGTTTKYVNISVEDNGTGIDEERLGEIFDKFTRVDNEFSDTVTGTGLGLYWVKQIVDLHGGKIDVKSELGKGSKFTIKLPI